MNKAVAIDPLIERCPRCKARIIWCKTASSKLQPLDAEPCPTKGNIRLLPANCCETVPALEIAAMTPLERAAAGLRASHFAACPPRRSR